MKYNGCICCCEENCSSVQLGLPRCWGKGEVPFPYPSPHLPRTPSRLLLLLPIAPFRPLSIPFNLLHLQKFIFFRVHFSRDGSVFTNFHRRLLRGQVYGGIPSAAPLQFSELEDIVIQSLYFSIFFLCWVLCYSKDCPQDVWESNLPQCSFYHDQLPHVFLVSCYARSALRGPCCSY